MIAIIIPQFQSGQQLNLTDAEITNPSKPLKSAEDIDIIFQGFAYSHDFQGFNGEVSGEIYVGRDFDYWNEEWRGLVEFDISAIPDYANITDVKLQIEVSGKPKVCDYQRVQLCMYQMELQPSTSSYNFQILFEDAANGTLYNNESCYTLANNGYYPGQSTFYDLGNQSNLDLQSRLSDDWFALGFKDYYTDDLGHDEDQDEGIICGISQFIVNYEIANTTYEAIYSASASGTTDQTGETTFTEGQSDGSNFVAIILILMALIIAIVCIAMRRVFEKPKPQAEELTPLLEKNSKPKPKRKKKKEKLTTRQEFAKAIKSDQDLLRKFQNILEISQRVKIADVARSLGLSYDDLFEKLLQWKEHIPFKIDGEMIVVDNLGNFMTALDSEFDQWEHREYHQEGKT